MSSAVKTHRTYFAPTWPSFGFPLHAERSKQMIQSGAGRVNDKIHASEILGWETLSHRFITITERARTDEAFFIRHGATKYNERNLVSGQHNTSLSTKGKDEARRLRYFLPQKIDLIVCSELRRSIETMILSVPEELLQKIPVRSDFRLNEVHLGALQGKRRHHIGHFASGDLDFAPEGGESYRQAARRVLSAVVDMFDALASTGSPPCTAVVFCHAGVLRIVSTLLAKQGKPKELFDTAYANAQCLKIPAAEISLPSYWIRGGTGHRDTSKRSK